MRDLINPQEPTEEVLFSVEINLSPEINIQCQQKFVGIQMPIVEL